MEAIMKRILIPTDFSDCAEYATISAASIAQNTGAELHFIHIVDAPIEWVKLPKEKELNYPETKAKIGHARSYFEELKKRPEMKKIKINSMLAFNIAYEDIMEYAEKIKADLIVMGTHGTSGFSEYFIGSTTQRVVRMANQPVLTMRCSSQKFKPKKIVFASDFKEDYSKPFKKFSELAKALDANIHLLFVNTPGFFKETDEINAAMKSFAKANKLKDSSLHIYSANNVERGIIKFSKAVDADLIAAISKGKNILFGNSTTEALVNHSPMPVLSINLG
jgi:nucleotide-binding universal stress UspA family protein